MSVSSESSSHILPCPDILKNDIVALTVPFIDFEGTSHTGVIEVHYSIQRDIIDLFEFMRDISFPIHSVKTIDHFTNDDHSMEENNTSAFCFRTVALKPHEISLHGYGCAIDINPIQNPYINKENILPKDSVYDPTKKGTLYSQHPIVSFLKERGFTWGGDWNKPYRDYQHFSKELSLELIQKYQKAIDRILSNITDG